MGGGAGGAVGPHFFSKCNVKHKTAVFSIPYSLCNFSLPTRAPPPLTKNIAPLPMRFQGKLIQQMFELIQKVVHGIALKPGYVVLYEIQPAVFCFES